LLLASVAALEPRAERLPEYSLLELTIQAQLVVVAESEPPLRFEEGQKPSRFKVLEILKGRVPKPGEALAVHRLDLYRLSGFAPIQRALIFLERDPEDEKKLSAILSGIRLLTHKSEVLRPVQKRNPGPYVFSLGEEQDWPKVINRVKESMAKVAPILELQRVEDVAKRNEAVLNWIEGNRKEFGFKRFDHDGVQEGLGSLGWTMFRWVMDSCLPADCWRAATLYRELYGSHPETDSKRPSFGSVEGRAFLSRIAFDESRPEEDRVRALEWLLGSLWPYSDPAMPRIGRLDRAEADALIEKAKPFLRAKSEQMRGAAVGVVFGASYPPSGSMSRMATMSALPDLVNAYRPEPPGVVRDALAVAIRRIGGADHWDKLTGNTKGTLVTLYSFGKYGEEALFMLSRTYAAPAEPVTECPTMVLTQLDEDGKQVSVQERPLPATYPPDPWEKGWGTGGSGNIEVRFSTRGLASGTWEVHVKGTTGFGEKSPWRSEPKRFRLP
jgi:hypothetical protein